MWSDITQAIDRDTRINFEFVSTCWLSNKKFPVTKKFSAAALWGLWKLSDLCSHTLLAEYMEKLFVWRLLWVSSEKLANFMSEKHTKFHLKFKTDCKQARGACLSSRSMNKELFKFLNENATNCELDEIPPNLKQWFQKFYGVMVKGPWSWSGCRRPADMCFIETELPSFNFFRCCEKLVQIHSDIHMFHDPLTP